MVCFPVISPGPSHYNHRKSSLTTFSEFQFLSLHSGIYINMQQQKWQSTEFYLSRGVWLEKELSLIMNSWAWFFTGCTLHASLNTWLKLNWKIQSILPSVLQPEMTNNIIEWTMQCWCSHSWKAVPCDEHRLVGTPEKGKRSLKRWHNCLRKTGKAKWHLARLAWNRGKFIESPHLNSPL